ncbi:MAG: glycoside hydrolase family 88 protein [Opitutales bacterium]|nr:glycoside hydrolase family 88 protein [Opitutales bacterium]
MDSTSIRTCQNAAQKLMGYPWKLWFWGDSAGLEGLIRAAELTGDPACWDYVYGLLKGWSARSEPRRMFDHTAAGQALIESYRKYKDPALLEAALRLAEYLSAFRRLPNGCPVHYEDAHIELPPELPEDHPQYDPELESVRQELRTDSAGPCVFVDSMHFQAPFFAHLFEVTGDGRYKDEAFATLSGQMELVWDDDACLFHHFWIERQGKPNGVHWGRGQGWAMLGIIETLKVFKNDSGFLDKFVPVLNQLFQSMVRYQHSSGDWHTVVDAPDAYLESSVAAFFVKGYAEAKLSGWLEVEYDQAFEKAWAAMWKHAKEDGRFLGVSFETFPSLNVEHYKQMPVNAIVPWGHGPFLSACEAYSRLKR